MAKFRYVGMPRVHLRAREAVTGKLRFVGDLSFPGLLCGAIVRSPVPHARIKRIDVSRALALPGVKAVVTGEDSPEVRYGLHIADETVLARGKVRYIGEEVAAVAAVDERTAERAANLIEVEYEELPAVFDPEEAIGHGSALVHAEFPDNVARKVEFAYGDTEAAFREAYAVIERTYTTSHQWHAPLERVSCVAWFSEPGNLTVWAPLQDPSGSAASLARVFGLPESKVRVVQTPTGGSFGSKLFHQKLQYVCALLSLRTGAPVRMTTSVREEMTAGRPRIPAKIRIRLGVDREGRIIARETDIVANNGAYSSYATGAFLVMCHRSEALYDIPNVNTRGRLVYTNTVPTAGFRGFGNVTAMFALESAVDEAARALGMDPIDFRLKNCVREGHVTHLGWKIRSCGLPECLERVRAAMAAWGCAQPRPASNLRRGRGVACAIHVSSNRTRPFDGSVATVRLNADGSVTVVSGDPDIGPGLSAVFTLIVAETLGIPPERVEVAPVDTMYSPFGLGVWADRGTTISGKAVEMAVREVRQRILAEAAAMLGADAGRLDLEDGWVVEGGSRKLTLAEVASKCRWKPGGGAIEATATFDPDTVMVAADHIIGSNPSTGYTFTALGVEVEVDVGAGMFRVARAVSAHDSGTIVNPLLARGQVYGGFAHGLGYASSEEFILDKGRVVNDSLSDYLIPASVDMPRAFDIEFVETYEPTGPYGAKGLGQDATLCVAPAIANALHDALGVRLTYLPLTAERVWRAIRNRKEGR